MSVPSRKPLPAQSFFGKSYPRAIGALTDDDKLVVGSNRPQMPNAPFLQWAGTADWRRGGTGSHLVGKPPKEPITPFEAYEMYLDSQAAKAVADTAQQKDGSTQAPEGNKEVTVVPEDAQRSWEALAPKERAIFEELARDDAKRFQEAATAFELANPGWFERRHEWKQPRRAPGAKRAGPQRAKTSPKRPRPALTPWKAFLKVILEKVKQRDPEAAASLKAADLLRLATEQAGPIWEKMADADKAEYLGMAAEDQARYERELDAYQKAQADTESHGADTSSRGPPASRQGKPQSKRIGSNKAAADGAKGARKRKQAKPVKAVTAAEAKEAAAAVDVTGLTPMQAWAEKQRAARHVGAAPKRAKRATRRTSAARGELPLDKVSPLAARAAGAGAAAPAGGGAPAPAARRTINPAQQLRQQQQALEAAELPGLDAMPAEVHAGSGAALSDGEESGGGDQGGGCHEDDNVSISSSSSSEPGSARGGGDEEENGSEALTEGMTEDMTDDVLELAPDEGPSQVPDMQPPATEGKGAGDGGMLGRMRSALADGLGWLTSGRKRRGVMASMQDAPLEQPTAERPGAGAGSPATAAKRAKRATPRRLERSLTDFDKITFDEAPSSAAKRRRIAK